MSGSPLPRRAPPPAQACDSAGWPVFAPVVVEMRLGSKLVVAGSPYQLAYLTGHVAFAVVVSEFAGNVLLRPLQRHHAPLRDAAAITFLPAVGATLGGSWFLVGGVSNSALHEMEGFGGPALLGALLVIIWGGAWLVLAPAAQ